MPRFILVCAIFITACSCTAIPNTLKRCERKNKDFDACLADAITDALQKSKSATKEIGLQVLEPLEIPSLVIGAGAGAVGFQQNYNNLTVSGVVEAKCSKAQMDFEGKTLKLQVTAPLVRLDFQYEINGKILLLPIHGKGPGFIEMVDPDFDIVFNLEEYQKKGQIHYKVTSCKLTFVPKLVRFQLDNLFDGDEALGKNINQVLNDNWSEVLGDVKASYEDAFGQIFSAIFDRVLKKVSAAELF